MPALRPRSEWVKDHQGPLAKAYAVEITRAADGPDGNRIRTFRITTDSPDRERDVISASGWRLENYQKNPVVLFGHDYKSLPIGKAVAIRQEAHGLSADVEFAPKEIYPFADTVLGLVDFGALKATSVGFDPVKWSLNEERRGYDFQEQELLEFSIVPVPANAEALQLAVKGMGTERFGLYRTWVEEALVTLRAVDGADDTPPEGYASMADFLAKTVLRPYPNEHACRLADPGDFTQFRRGSRSTGGKTYSVIYGQPKGGGGWREQAYRYGTDTWTASEARSHCGGHDGSFEAASRSAERPMPEPEPKPEPQPEPEPVHARAFALELEEEPVDLIEVDVDALLATQETTLTPEEFKAWLREAVEGIVDEKVATRVRQLTGRLD